MGLFSRQPRDGPTTTTRSHHHKHRDDGPLDRPTFGQWFRMTWLDLLTMVIMGALGLGIYMARPAPTRSFPITFSDGEIVYPEFAYPMRKNLIPIWLSAFLSFTIPFVIFILMQLRIRSFWDLNNATIGLLYSLIAAAVFQVFLKWLIGGLRPHFLTVCKPLVDSQMAGTGYKQIMYDRKICSGDEKEINDSLESFPSGHSTAAFAGFVFLFLYLNARLKVWSNYHPAFWKLIAIMAPLLGATLIASSLTIDEYHNWYDCLAGAIIGTMMAFASYRMVFAAIWDWRWNHLPLDREVGFGFQGMSDRGVFTRSAGWGSTMGGTGNGHGNGTVGGNGYPSGTDPRRGSVERRPVGAPPAAMRRGDHIV